MIRARDESKCCGPFRDAAHEEREPEHQDTVRENRADECRLDDLEQPGVQRKQRDEQFRQIAERGLDDARAPEPSREPSCSVAGPTRRASRASATAATMNVTTASKPVK